MPSTSKPLPVTLHNYLQWVMGWRDSHAHEFHVGDHIVAPDWWIEEMQQSPADAAYRDERRVSVAAVVKELGIRGEFEYHYDMGDGWQHRIVIEATADAIAGMNSMKTWCDGSAASSIRRASI